MLKAAASVMCCFRRFPEDMAADEPKDSCCSCCCWLSTLDAADIEHCRQQEPSKHLQQATSSILIAGPDAKMRRVKGHIIAADAGIQGLTVVSTNEGIAILVLQLPIDILLQAV